MCHVLPAYGMRWFLSAGLPAGTSSTVDQQADAQQQGQGLGQGDGPEDMLVFQPEGEQAQEQGRKDQTAAQRHAHSLQGAVEPGQVTGDAHVQAAEEKAPAEVGDEVTGQAAHSGVVGQEKAGKFLRVEAEDKEHDHAQCQQAQQGDVQESVRPLAQSGSMVGTDQGRQGICYD